MRGFLQEGFATIESIWCTCQGNRELARGIGDPDEFEEIREAAEKLAYIANDIYQMSQGQSDRRECFGSHPSSIQPECLRCGDEGACE